MISRLQQEHQRLIAVAYGPSSARAAPILEFFVREFMCALTEAAPSAQTQEDYEWIVNTLGGWQMLAATKRWGGGLVKVPTTGRRLPWRDEQGEHYFRLLVDTLSSLSVRADAAAIATGIERFLCTRPTLRTLVTWFDVLVEMHEEGVVVSSARELVVSYAAALRRHGILCAVLHPAVMGMEFPLLRGQEGLVLYSSIGPASNFLRAFPADIPRSWRVLAEMVGTGDVDELCLGSEGMASAAIIGALLEGRGEVT